MSAKVREKGTMELGVSGHYGTEEYRPARVAKTVESWSGNVDLRYTPCDRWELVGEFFVGENLGAYYGGVGQTVNLMKNEIAARGGWAELSCKPVARLSLNAGYGFDDPDDEDFRIPIATIGTKSFIGKNSNVFGSVMYGVTSTVTVMVEVSQLATTYMYKAYQDDELMASSKDFDDMRVQFSLKAAIK